MTRGPRRRHLGAFVNANRARLDGPGSVRSGMPTGGTRCAPPSAGRARSTADRRAGRGASARTRRAPPWRTRRSAPYRSKEAPTTVQRLPGVRASDSRSGIEKLARAHLRELPFEARARPGDGRRDRRLVGRDRRKVALLERRVGNGAQLLEGAAGRRAQLPVRLRETRADLRARAPVQLVHPEAALDAGDGRRYATRRGVIGRALRQGGCRRTGGWRAGRPCARKSSAERRQGSVRSTSPASPHTARSLPGSSRTHGTSDRDAASDPCGGMSIARKPGPAPVPVLRDGAGGEACRVAVAGALSLARRPRPCCPARGIAVMRRVRRRARRSRHPASPAAIGRFVAMAGSTPSRVPPARPSRG